MTSCPTNALNNRARRVTLKEHKKLARRAPVDAIVVFLTHNARHQPPRIQLRQRQVSRMRATLFAVGCMALLGAPPLYTGDSFIAVLAQDLAARLDNKKCTDEGRESLVVRCAQRSDEHR